MTADKVFGPEFVHFVHVVKELSCSLKGFKYRFMPSEDYEKLKKIDKKEAAYVYWLEILYRAHSAAVTSIMRNHCWMKGALLAAGNNNYLLTMAAFRGFIESAADTDIGLRDVPLTLAECSKVIEQALQRNFCNPVEVNTLEDKLIHYAFARKLHKNSEYPESHRAKKTSEYLNSLENGGENGIKDCYSELCEAVHPASLSVAAFISVDKDGNEWEISASDETLINDFCIRYQHIMPIIFSHGVTIPMLVLRAINEFPITELRTEAVKQIDFRQLPAWQKIHAAFQTATVPPKKISMKHR